jgi:hypothetical protein
MASADCECCGQPTTVPDPIEIEPEECTCDCFDCDECPDCGPHELEIVQPPVLCGHCVEVDAGEGCGAGAWHCTCGRACDGTACPGDQYQAYADYVAEVSDADL